MSKLNRWIRRLHRWLVIPFLLAIISLSSLKNRGDAENAERVFTRVPLVIENSQCPLRLCGETFSIY